MMLLGFVGFTVNMPWVRAHYFAELVDQIARISADEEAMALAVHDEHGQTITAVGTPEHVADVMQTWLQSGACDGFVMQTLQIPLELGLFVDEVVPILQRRGLQRTDYRGSTLREHLGLVGASRTAMASA